MTDIEKYSGKNIVEVFLDKKKDEIALELKREKEAAWKIPEYRNERIREFRELFSKKMKTIIPERDWIKFFGRTSFVNFIETNDGGKYKYILQHKIIVKESLRNLNDPNDTKKLDEYLNAFIDSGFSYYWKSFVSTFKEHINGSI
jgi:hypothetical protein